MREQQVFYLVLKYSPCKRGTVLITSSLFHMLNVWGENNPKIKQKKSHEGRCFSFIHIRWNYVNNEHLSQVFVEILIWWCRPSWCTSRKRKDMLLQCTWPALGFCNGTVNFPPENSELFVTRTIITHSTWYLQVYSWLEKRMLQVTWHAAMLLRKLFPVIDKCKDWLVGQWTEKNTDMVHCVSLSLSLLNEGFKVEHWGFSVSPLGGFSMHWLP